MRPLYSSVLIAGASLAPAVPLAAPHPPRFVVALMRDASDEPAAARGPDAAVS